MADEQQTNQIPEHVPLGRRFPPTIPQQSLPTPTTTTTNTITTSTTEYIAPNSPTHTGSPPQRQSQSIPTATTPPNSRTQQQSSANNNNNHSNNNNNNSNNKSARPTKRQKVSLACQECRDRKIKCDGERPICGPCIKKKRPEGSCVYEPERGRRGVKSQYVQLLENKVRELENAMRFEQGNDRSPSITSIDRPPEFAPRNPNLSINHLTSPSASFRSSPPHISGSQASPIGTSLIGVSSPAPDSIITPEISLGHQQQDLGGIRTHAPESNVRERWTSESPFPGVLPSLQPPSNQQQSHRLAPLLPQPSSPKQHVSPLPPPISQTQTQPSTTSSNSRTLPPPASLPQRSVEPEVDAMGASTGIIPPDPRGENHGGDNDNRQGYFGSSSAMSFMREVREVIGKKTTLSPDENRSHGSPSRRLSQSSRSSRNTSSAGGGSRSIIDTHTNITNNHNNNVNKNHTGGQIRSYTVCHDYVLPPRKVADSLVRSYWTFVHTLYPFLHKPGFMRTYSKLWGYPDDDHNDADHESEGDPLFHCILNLVFALGCQLSPDIGESEREPTSDVFFQRSKKLLHFDILDEGNIKVVQALLLMGQYLQCTKMPGRCWIVVGLATRVAQGLGLHRDGHNINNGRHKTNGSGCTRQLERELRKRLWGGCLVLDRVISMAYGRPFMIPVTQNLILPEAIDDELLTSYPDPPAKQPEDKPTRMAFFVHTLQLYEIMGDILTTLYSTGTRRTNEEASIVSDEQLRASNISSVIRLEMALNTWEKALPWFLRLGIYTQDSANSPRNRRSMTDNILLRQNNVLRARYLHTCILLYRPVFAHFFALEESNHVVSQDTGLQRSVFLQSSITCVSSAQELVEMIHRNIKELLPAWWYNMFYLYTSATVLLMARLFPKIKQAIGEDYLTESWDKCLSCLSEYQSYSESAKWCFESLSELNKIAFQSNDEQPNNGMSSIQILGTLPVYTSNLAAASEKGEMDNMGGGPSVPVGGFGGAGAGPNTSILNPNFSTIPENNNPGTDWELDLQDMTWLGRLPVLTDFEPGLQFNQWLGRIDTDVNNL